MRARALSVPPCAISKTNVQTNACIPGQASGRRPLLSCLPNRLRSAPTSRSVMSGIVDSGREGGLGNIDANDVVDGAHSAASKCHRMVASKQTTLRGAVHGRRYHDSWMPGTRLHKAGHDACWRLDAQPCRPSFSAAVQVRQWSCGIWIWVEPRNENASLTALEKHGTPPTFGLSPTPLAPIG
jgi:hypothetical protein